jgi:hypothetical protein
MNSTHIPTLSQKIVAIINIYRNLRTQQMPVLGLLFIILLTYNYCKYYKSLYIYV